MVHPVLTVSLIDVLCRASIQVPPNGTSVPPPNGTSVPPPNGTSVLPPNGTSVPIAPNVAPQYVGFDLQWIVCMFLPVLTVSLIAVFCRASMQVPPNETSVPIAPSLKMAAQAASSRSTLVVDEATGRVTFDFLLSNSLPEVVNTPDDLEAWASYATISNERVYGDGACNVNFSDLSMNTAGYEREKARTFERFLNIMARHQDLHKLTEVIADPDNPSKQTLRLFTLLRGYKTPEKAKCLNLVLYVFVSNLYTKAGQVYQPNALKKMLDHVFSVLHTNGIQYGSLDLQNLPRSYHAYCKKQFEEESEARPDYGRRPKKAKIVQNDEYLFRNKANPKLNPFSVPINLLRLVVYKFQRDFGPRGTIEVSTV